MVSSKRNTSKSVNLSEPRPPVVAILGHIDHGKTSLLDKIRHTQVVETESGGITQHTSACRVIFQKKPITFVDTPGHAAFSKMRSRGVKVADLNVLVVAADEGVKPQTKECLEHIMSAGIPFLVAVNKIDLPNVDLDRVYQQLADQGVKVEKKGGQIVAVPVSAKTGQGVDDLLEMILLLAEMADLKIDEKSSFRGVVIESTLDKSKGPLATVLVRRGWLQAGDEVRAEKVIGKVKALFDDQGRSLQAAGPGQPVEILGFKSVPPVGGLVEKSGGKALVLPSSSDETGISEDDSRAKVAKESGGDTPGRLKVILKADTVGTLEAIIGSLPEGVETVLAEVGDVSESDILLADSFGAQILGFKVKVGGTVKKLAQVEKVNYLIFQTIYELLEDIEKKVLKLMEPSIDEEILGEAEVIAEFEIKKQRVAGCRVVRGKITKRDKLHLKRGTEDIGQSRIKSMQKGRDSINVTEQGEEFGLILDNSLDFKIGDVLLSYRNKVEEKK